MAAESSPGVEAYPVSCSQCAAPFDALAASWCDCLSSRRSLVCPTCGTCFCKAPPPYKTRFWQEAPRTLWDRSAAAHTPPALPTNPEPDAVRHPLVLVVDDEADIRRMAGAAIEIAGYGVVFATNGEEGLDAATRYRPELVLTDAFMPKMDGREMCQRIKSDPACAAARVVIMTSLYTASRYKYEAFKEFRADDYLTKPLDLEQLRALLARHLSTSGAS